MADGELCLICWARGRGGMTLTPEEFDLTMKARDNTRNFQRPNKMGRSTGSSKNVQSSTTGHSIHMRGLPFESTVADVHQFFAPFNLVDVRLLYEESGRPKGECDVDLATHSDAEAAMAKDKENMGHRYIELFLYSTEDGKAWSTTNNSFFTQMKSNRNLYNRMDPSSTRDAFSNGSKNTNSFMGHSRNMNGDRDMGRTTNFNNNNGFGNGNPMGNRTYSSFPKGSSFQNGLQLRTDNHHGMRQ